MLVSVCRLLIFRLAEDSRSFPMTCQTVRRLPDHNTLLSVFPLHLLWIGNHQSVRRASDTYSPAIQDVGIDHRRFHVTMAHQLLHRFGREARNAESQVQTENIKRTVMERRIPEWGKSARGAIQPMSQERRHGGGKQGDRMERFSRRMVENLVV